MVVEIYHVGLTIMEHTYFASREVGILYESEPLIGNYALTYALGLCAAPYDWAGPPRYKQDLEPLNEQGIYVTPATFEQGKLRYVISQFNAQSDGYYFRFDQNAIRTDPAQKARPANFPQSGKIRMLGLDSQAYFYLINQQGSDLNLPNYIRLGKFNSKARLEWEQLSLVSAHPQPSDQALDFLLNAADLPPAVIANLRAFSVYNIYPAPLLRHSHLEGNFWHCKNKTGKDIYLPTDMRFGVGGLE
ncbi:MAG TPA: type I-D CRISPR-associated protein Cas5/Csc1 [Ktedonobacteraceae bacterium]|nr:type I-D CRISPR-associated protein Cas5/Csc1 [Ktedonobacteraceae bacterium]